MSYRLNFNNFPVPVLAEDDAKGLRNAEMRRAGSVNEARESTDPNSAGKMRGRPASRGGETLLGGGVKQPCKHGGRGTEADLNRAIVQPGNVSPAAQSLWDIAPGEAHQWYVNDIYEQCAGEDE